VITSRERTLYERAARRDGITNFEIKEPSPQGQLVRAGRRDQYIPVYYLETVLGNKRFLGFDSASDPMWREVMDGARDSGKPTATQEMMLLSSNKKPGFVVFLPIFRRGLNHSIEDRRRNLRGYISGVFRIQDIPDNISKSTEVKDINIRLSQGEIYSGNAAERAENMPIGIAQLSPALLNRVLSSKWPSVNGSWSSLRPGII
jgi:CHASE1-domain containing sensor protein